MNLTTGRSMVGNDEDEEFAARLDDLRKKNGKSFESFFDNLDEGKG